MNHFPRSFSAHICDIWGRWTAAGSDLLDPEGGFFFLFPRLIWNTPAPRIYHAPVPAPTIAATDCGVIVIYGRRMMTNNNIIYFVCPPRVNVVHAALPQRQLCVNLVLELPLQTLAVSSAGTRARKHTHRDAHTNSQREISVSTDFFFFEIYFMNISCNWNLNGHFSAPIF